MGTARSRPQLRAKRSRSARIESSDQQVQVIEISDDSEDAAAPGQVFLISSQDDDDDASPAAPPQGAWAQQPPPPQAPRGPPPGCLVCMWPKQLPAGAGVTLPCGHRFHGTCWNDWSEISRAACPLCPAQTPFERLLQLILTGTADQVSAELASHPPGPIDFWSLIGLADGDHTETCMEANDRRRAVSEALSEFVYHEHYVQPTLELLLEAIHGGHLNAAYNMMQIGELLYDDDFTDAMRRAVLTAANQCGDAQMKRIVDDEIETHFEDLFFEFYEPAPPPPPPPPPRSRTPAQRQLRSAYTLLRPTGPSAAQIRSAYKRRALQNHPDRGGDQQTMKRINNAHSLLMGASQKDRRRASQQ